MNSVLIPRFQQNGAAFASVISELLVTILSLYFARKHLNIKLFTKSTLLSLISGSVMIIFIVLFRIQLNINDKLQLVITITLGIIVYVMLSLVLKHPVLFELLDLVKNKKNHRGLPDNL